LRFLREHEHTCDFENMVVSIDCTSAHFSAHVSYSFNLLLDLSSSLLVLLWLLFQFCLVWAVSVSRHVLGCETAEKQVLCIMYYICMCTCMCKCISICICICTCICICLCICICIYSFHGCTQLFIYYIWYMYICTCIYCVYIYVI
jgi:hypothetical protein